MSEPLNLLVDDDQPLHPVDAVAAILVAPGGRYVLQLRDEKPGIFFPGFWGCFGGGVDPDDSGAPDTLRRELHEELNLDLPEAALTYFTTLTFDLSFAGLRTTARTYYEARLSQVQLAGARLGEGRAFRAFSPREALTGLKLAPYDSFVLWLHAARDRLS